MFERKPQKRNNFEADSILGKPVGVCDVEAPELPDGCSVYSCVVLADGSHEFLISGVRSYLNEISRCAPFYFSLHLTILSSKRGDFYYKQNEKHERVFLFI
ncbi:hypothetical protein NPIL_656601 [Nephila pilipes]|uniref:Uncharacterized protein n=1 Tax=Nephila pilipes TaxID=299642 RepID=A0A8X6R4J5_NEPPI|nr:hypothetical protein NPIL_656601 [Nephila pilipes]